MSFDKPKIHKSVTLERVIDLVESSMFEGDLTDPGICLKCGEDQNGCEPDMCWGKCECCGAETMFGAEELMIRLAGNNSIVFSEEERSTVFIAGL